MEILDLKSIITQMKNSLDGPSSRFEMTEEIISESEDRLIEIIHSKEQRKRGLKKNKQGLRNLGVKHSNLNVMGVPKWGERKE